MDTKKVFEFWLTKPDGTKLNKYVSLLMSEPTDDDVKQAIEKKFDLDISKCTDLKIKAFD